MCQWRWRLLKKQQLHMAGFEQTQKTIILNSLEPNKEFGSNGLEVTDYKAEFGLLYIEWRSLDKKTKNNIIR